LSGKSSSSLSGCDPSVLSLRNALQHTSLAVGGPSWTFDSCCSLWMGLFSVILLLPKALGQTDSLHLASMHLLYPDCNASPLPRPALLVQWLLDLPSVDQARSGYGIISRLVRILPCPSLSGCAEPGLGPAPLCTQRSSAGGCLGFICVGKPWSASLAADSMFKGSSHRLVLLLG
jgi:hypothetical protein